MLAIYGKKLSFEERFVRYFYLAFDGRKNAVKKIKELSKFDYKSPFNPRDQKGITGKEFQEICDAFERHKKNIVTIFLGALYSHDGAAIMRLAYAVEFFKKNLKSPPVDVDRKKLLFAKMVFEKENESWPLWKIASFLGHPPADDGYSALRRKCKQLGVPFFESRKTSSRKVIGSLGKSDDSGDKTVG